MSLEREPSQRFGWPFMSWPGHMGMPAWNLAPDKLWQSVNPGWSFGTVVVNYGNSRAPDVEKAVVSQVSYGRQLGRLSEAVRCLVSAMPEVGQDLGVKNFLALFDEIEDLKQRAANDRLQVLREQLRSLKASDPEAWRELTERR